MGLYLAIKVSEALKKKEREIKKISLEKVTPELKERAQELQVKATREIEKLGEIICNFHKDFKMLREACQD